MKDLKTLDEYRDWKTEMAYYGEHVAGSSFAGVFHIPSCKDRKPMRLVVSSYDPWDHVSVSRKDRVPNWYEMCQMKEMFFHPEDMVMQLHPPKSEWISMHPNCLHLWRPWHDPIPKPPAMMVGVKGISPEQMEKMTIEQRKALRDRIANGQPVGSTANG